jgi:superfamily II DNA helicase RecQ
LLRRLRPGRLAALSGVDSDRQAPASFTGDGTAAGDALKAWRLRAAAGKPAYTVAHNRTLEQIAASRPGGMEALSRIHGIGPAFVARHAGDVLEIVAGHAQPAASSGI